MSTRLRELRHRQGWTQYDLSRRSKVALRTISAVEAGRPCRMTTKRKILKALGLDWSNVHQVFPS